jgi:hypothetical protein
MAVLKAEVEMAGMVLDIWPDAGLDVTLLRKDDIMQVRRL